MSTAQQLSQDKWKEALLYNWLLLRRLESREEMSSYEEEEPIIKR